MPGLWLLPVVSALYDRRWRASPDFDPEAHEPNQINLVFLANRASHKFDELENDAHVNVSFYDEKTTHWASYSGIAKISQDKDLIAKHWSSLYVFHCSLCAFSVIDHMLL